MEIIKNFKKVSIGILGTAILAIGLWACSNDTLSDEGSVNNNSDTSSYLESKMNVNPLEYIGIEHNLFLEQFTIQLENSYQQGEWDDIDFLSDEFRYKFSELMNDTYHISYEGSTSTVSAQIDIYNQLDLNEWYDGDEITPLDLAEDELENNASLKDKEFALNLLTDIFEISNNITDNELAYMELENVILYHEDLILSQNWEENEGYALVAVSIAKHSLIFWKDYDLTKFSNTQAKGKDPRSSIIVGADAVGSIIGGGLGAAGGSILGPGGTVGGWFGGTLAGGIGGSAHAITAIAIYDAWNDYIN